MKTPIICAYLNFRRTEAIADAISADGDHARAADVQAIAFKFMDKFDRLKAKTRRDVILKARDAIVTLESTGGRCSAGDILRMFFRDKRPYDASWLRDLDACIWAVEMATGKRESKYVRQCLRSISAGVRSWPEAAIES
ncbi:MAG: hypothetical protein ABI230_00600 [Aestuariivirga sp.]